MIGSLSGATTGRTEYEAFGNESYQDPLGDRGEYRFAGGKGYQNDDATGMQLLGARYYLPLLGRFLTQDPIGHEGGLNLYAYCDNSPLMAVDPSGLQGLNIGGYEFSGASIGKGLGVSGAAFLHTLSLHLWDGGAYRNEAGFAESSAAWTVASVVAPGAASGLGIRALERGVGHIAEKHLAKSFAYLAARTMGPRGVAQASSFISPTLTNALIRFALRNSRTAVDTWLYAGQESRMVLDVTSRMTIGYGVRQGGAKVALRSARIVLEKNAGGGFHVLTAFPK